MTKDQEKRVIDIYGPNYKPIDIPATIRQKEEAEDSQAQQVKADELRQEEIKN